MLNKFTKEKPFGFLTKLSSDKIINFNPLPPIGQKSIRILFSLSFFFILATTVIITLAKIQLPKQIPLYYSRPWGEEQLAKKELLYLIPAVSFFTLLISYPVSLFLLKKGDKFLASSCAGFPFIFALLGAVSVIRIILLTV